MMLDAFNGLEQFNHWLKNGGDVTLYSFPVPSLHSVESQYIDFIKQTEFYFETEKYIFVHAGLNFAHEDPFHDMNAMLWIRDFTVDRNKVKGKIIIHGHTPKPYNSIMSQLQLPDIAAIDLDGGCVYNYRADMGNLFAIDLTEMKFISVKNIDSSPAF